ncbi:hypothetical protein EMIHUDRAFT_221308 [Emiliania huxleyi CCMP1516]|uniref:Sulfotransferase domain-containing protein n=2 Tax=Emiliania huxleyi TaxID=2903 RepID=A0A0D3HYX8_EMIH1|nr:hypothetical protein EMIHUDRAFT_221308 [Emiliania huxleyi CCMP1516]EOD04213.1 hypothetical protein EMIHUDRAFT_221308 [Emiliania huxleyi CCMP1516]|eukprot:XP_005756642.1 hypothetical protein EMIHUDRAFT_221308 [Emiliania huxleyi CCMP1516]
MPLPILLVFPTVGILFADMVHNLSVCVQFKGGMSNWRDLFVGVADAKSDLDPHYSWLFSRTGTRAARIDHGIESFYASRPDWLHVRVLRDPVERMASGFLDWHHMDTRFNGHFIPQNTGCNTYKRHRTDAKGFLASLGEQELSELAQIAKKKYAADMSSYLAAVCARVWARE